MTDPAMEGAAGRLRGASDRKASVIEVFKGFREEEEHRLRMLHREGGGGRRLARQRSDMVDVMLRELFVSVAAEVAPQGLDGPLAVAAFGGYGRRELSPLSDIDIIFLHPRASLPPTTEETIRRVLMALWDIGFKVGHATRSLSGAIKQANADLITKTSLLESRFLAGSRDVFQTFHTRFEKECMQGREAEYFAWRLANLEDIHTKNGGTVYMQEPNVKEGVGGLRDYQNIHWLAYFKDRTQSLSRLVESRLLRESERRAIEATCDFLMRVRAEMQYLGGRASDRLTLQMQGRVAAAFGYQQKHILRKVEAFMRDYYSHTRTMQLTASACIERMKIRPDPPATAFFGLLKPKTERFDGFIARGGRLDLESREALAEDEFRLLRAFHHAQVRQIDLSPELRDVIRRRLALIDRTFQYARAARETFLAILSRKGEAGPTLRTMHDLGVLGRYIPEFGALTCLVQHEFYHRYTADEHTLVCIDKLDAILFTEDPKLLGYRALFQKLEDPDILYLALLLHDTGKAANTRQHEDASATLAQKVARRLHLSPKRRKMLITLVNAHTELSSTAQKRNLDDPETIAQFAAIAGTRANLDALMLLTLADGMGTSDENWSDWKEGLVWTLYRRTCDYLEHGRAALDFFRKNLDELRAEVSRLIAREEAEDLDAYFSRMPARYFHMFDAAAIAEHLRVFRTFLESHLREGEGALAPACRWIARPGLGHSEVWVCGWDRARLLERIAGAFVSCHLNILSADIFTRSDNLVLDIFRVRTTRIEPVNDTKTIERVETRLAESLTTEDFDFTPLLEKNNILRTYRISQEADLPTKILVSNTSHPMFTLVDVQTPDRLGLLYDLLRAFGEAGANIDLSRITTEMDVALDSFYVTDAEGRKLADGPQTRRLQRHLQRACSRPRAN
jgi:[protein-PII] uridylyltransferase